MSRRTTGWLRGRFRLPAVLGAIVLVAAGLWIVAGRTAQENGDWATVTEGDLVIGVEVTGTLRAIDSGSLGPPQLLDVWSFKIAYIAAEGDDVDQGTVVLGFDTTELQQKLQEKLAESQEARKQIEKTSKELHLSHRKDELRLAEAQSKLTKAHLKVDVPENLEKGNELASARLDLELARKEIDYLGRRIDAARLSAEAALAALQNQLDRAEQRVREIREGIEQMSVKAPRSGTVIHVTDWRDEKMKVGDSCWRGQNVIELPDLRRVMASGEVAEADAGRVADNQPVTLQLDAHPDLEFTGKVESIRRSVQRRSWRTPMKVVRVEIHLDRTDTTRMRPGMRFRGKVETERVADSLLVSSEAVFATPDGPVAYRRTLLGFETVRLKLGRRNEDHFEALEGLREGDRVSRQDLSEPEQPA